MSCSTISYSHCFCDVVPLRQCYLICHKNYDSTNCSLRGNGAENVPVNVVYHFVEELNILGMKWPICTMPDIWQDFHCNDSPACGWVFSLGGRFWSRTLQCTNPILACLAFLCSLLICFQTVHFHIRQYQKNKLQNHHYK